MDEALEQIKKFNQNLKFESRDYPIELILSRFIKGTLFKPNYQREFTWKPHLQCEFIESILLGLPMPIMFWAESEKDSYKHEIVDGFQRISTLKRFFKNELTLKNLKRLDKLNGKQYKDLSEAIQNKFLGASLRIFLLSPLQNESLKYMLFDRINRNSVLLEPMERRIGAYPGKVLDFIKNKANEKNFISMTPMTEKLQLSRIREELVLRFAVLSKYSQEYNHDVKGFFDKHLESMNESITKQELKKIEEEFVQVLEFVKRYFPKGFSKEESNITPNIRFEAISMGVLFALREKPNLELKEEWKDTEEFKKITTGDASNSRPKFITRVEYTKNRLLKELCK
ncbi:MAG: DUF262 domain-containing protein [Candidatus Melainabacteria bacterium]